MVTAGPCVSTRACSRPAWTGLLVTPIRRPALSIRTHARNGETSRGSSHFVLLLGDGCELVVCCSRDVGLCGVDLGRRRLLCGWFAHALFGEELECFGDVFDFGVSDLDAPAAVAEFCVFVFAVAGFFEDAECFAVEALEVFGDLGSDVGGCQRSHPSRCLYRCISVAYSWCVVRFTPRVRRPTIASPPLPRFVTVQVHGCAPTTRRVWGLRFQGFCLRLSQLAGLRVSGSCRRDSG